MSTTAPCSDGAPAFSITAWQTEQRGPWFAGWQTPFQADAAILVDSHGERRRFAREPDAIAAAAEAMVRFLNGRGKAWRRDVPDKKIPITYSGRRVVLWSRADPFFKKEASRA